MPLRPIGCTFAALRVQPFDDARDVGAIVLVVERIRLGHAHDVAHLDLRRIDQAEDAELALALLDQLRVGLVPRLVALEDEVLEAEAGAPFLDEVRRPRRRNSGCGRPALPSRGRKSSCRGSCIPAAPPAPRSGSRDSADRARPRPPAASAGGSIASSSCEIGIDETT